jgi:hypothetical protein
MSLSYKNSELEFHCLIKNLELEYHCYVDVSNVLYYTKIMSDTGTSIL